MTQRRRFFAATPVQTVPGQTVAVEVQMRRNAPAPVVESPFVEPPVVEPPVWSGWEDDDGNRMVDLSCDAFRKNNDYGYEFDRGMFVAVVDGAQYVQWNISFIPAWGGTPIEEELRSDEFWGNGAMSLIACPENYWPRDTVEFRGAGGSWIDGVYVPCYVAAGNTLSVSLCNPRAAMPGKLTAVAKNLEDVEIGRVTLHIVAP